MQIAEVISLGICRNARKKSEVGSNNKPFKPMKTFKKLMVIAGLALFFSSCAVVKAPLTGVIYTDVKSPVAVTDSENSTKVGTAEATSILGIVATGDASVEAAAKSAGITEIHHVDAHSTSILGVFAKYTIYVYGE